MEGLSTASVYISGPGGRAVAVADQGIWTMTMDAPAPEPADRRHLHLLGQADPHLEVMDDVWPFEQARRRLRRAWATDRLCRLTLVLLDPGHSLRLRRQLAPVLEDLLAEVGSAPLSELLLSAAPPPELDLVGGTDLAGPQLSALLTELSPRLSTLREAVAAWAELVSTLPTLERAEVHHVIQTEALPRIGRGEERSVLLRWAMQQLARKPQSLTVVNTWLSRVVPQAARVQPKKEKKKASSSKRDVVQHTIHGRKTQVESQLVQITAALEAADIVAADRLLGFLREYQTDQGSRDFLAKSLCTLAQRAEALGQLAWAKNCLEEAVELAPVDPVALSQLSTWERRYGSPQRALEWMERALSNSRDAKTRNQHAETLRALGRLPEALAAYGETVGAFPESAVARSGLAETLRALGRLPEALAAYGEAVRAFPESVVARCGQAEVLRALGRLPEALAAYGETVRAFPADAVARNGQASLLLRLRRAQEALPIFSEVLQHYPSDSYARAGKAMALLQLGRLAEAEALLPLPSVPATEQDYALYRFRAILECKKKNWVEAEKLLQTVTQCRFPEQKWKAAALLGGLEIRRGKTAESRKILADFPEVDALSAGVRSLMQGWTDAEARLLTEARQRLEALRSPEADVATFKSSLQRRYGLAGTKADPKVDLWEPWLDLVS